MKGSLFQPKNNKMFLSLKTCHVSCSYTLRPTCIPLGNYIFNTCNDEIGSPVRYITCLQRVCRSVLEYVLMALMYKKDCKNKNKFQPKLTTLVVRLILKHLDAIYNYAFVVPPFLPIVDLVSFCIHIPK